MIATLEVLKKNLFVYVWVLPFFHNIVSEQWSIFKSGARDTKVTRNDPMGTKADPAQQYSIAAISAHIPERKWRRGLLSMEKKMQQNIRNVKWEAKTYIFKPSSYKWLCLSIIMFSAIFNIEVHEDRFLGDLLNKNLQAPCRLLLHPGTDRRHQTPWRDIQVHAGPSWACGRLPQWSSCAAEISLKAEYQMCVLQKILKKRSYPGFSYRLM